MQKCIMYLLISEARRDAHIGTVVVHTQYVRVALVAYLFYLTLRGQLNQALQSLSLFIYPNKMPFTTLF